MKGLSALHEFCGAMICETDVDQVLQGVLVQYLKAFECAESGMLFVYRPGPERLLVHSALGYDATSAQEISLRPGEPIAGAIFQSGQAMIYPTSQEVREALAGMTSENRAHLLGAVHGYEYPLSILCVPLVCGDARIGALSLESWRGPGEFSESDRQHAETLAHVSSLAIDRVRVIRELEHAQAMLEQAGTLQQDIMSTLSHEMRTPLASIKGYASALLLEDVRWDDKTTREYLQVIVEESDKLGEITADLLDVSMIDAGHLETRKEPTLLSRLAQDVVDEASQHTDKHSFLVTFAPGFPIVDADSGRIRRVLFNLVDNAVKYSPGGLVVIRGDVRENEVVVSVADQGPGIAPEYLNRLFERFFRVKFVSGHHVVGSGLGLPIARNIVGAHGGRIWAESKLGEGTTISFTLPLGGLSNGIERSEE